MPDAMGNVKYEVWFEGNELKWSRQAVDALDSVEKKTKVAGSAIDGMSNASRQSGVAMSNLSGKLKKLIGGYFSFQALAKVVRIANEEYLQSEQASKELANAASHLSGVTDGQISVLKKQATALSQTTKYDDDLIISAQALILRFAKSTDATGRLTETTLDLASALGIDLNSAALMIGKAMSGNSIMLSRYGINFTDAQEKVLKFGDANERAALLVDKLSGMFGGNAKQAADEYGGSIAIAENNLKNLAGAIYSNAIPGITALTKKISEAAAAWTDYLTVSSEATAKMNRPGSSEMETAQRYYNQFEAAQKKLNESGGKGTFFESKEDLQSEIDANYNAYLQYYDISLNKALEYKNKMKDISPITAGFDAQDRAKAAAAKQKAAAAKQQAQIVAWTMPEDKYAGASWQQPQMSQFGAYTNVPTTGAYNMQGGLDAAQVQAANKELERQNQIVTRITGQESLASQAALNSITLLQQGVATLGDGIASGLVDGFYDWKQAGKQMLKMLISMTAQMLIMETIAIAIKAALGSATGGTSMLAGLILHQGGQVPRHHSGVLSRDEHIAILQAGEYVMRRQAVQKIGVSNMEKMNRTGQSQGTGAVYNISVSLASTTTNPRQLAAELGPHIVRYIQNENERGKRVA